VRKTKREAQAEVEKWNESYPVGTPVLYTPVAGFGETRVEYTRAKARIVAASEPVVWITGHLCAIAISWLKPMPRYSMQRDAPALLRLSEMARLIFVVGPLMGYYQRVIHCVQRAGLDAQAAELSVLFHDVLEGQRHPVSGLDVEGIQQRGDVIGRHDTLDVIVRRGLHTELIGQFGGRSEAQYSLCRRSLRWL
jgi:hypothetical protein